jgi:prepilin-type N-terminal cleavage/methylation domain-containing protein
MGTITHRRRGQAGFTLVEAMVAIAILSMSITGPLVIAQKGIASAVYSRDQVTAFYLAQEAVEYVRNVRDTNANKTPPLGREGLANCISQSCAIDARYPVFTAEGAPNVLAIKVVTPGPSEPFISIEKSSGLYGYVAANTPGWTPTLFKRTIYISLPQGDSGPEMIVSVKVSWNTTLFAPPKEFTVKEILFNI